MRAAIAALLVALAAALTLLPARNHETAATGSGAGHFRVGLVFDIGGRGDKSFNDAAYLGVDRAARDLGVTASYLEPSGTGDREAALRRFAALGYDLVIGVGFLFSSDIDAVARSFPKVHFACVDYAPSPGGIPANVTGLAFREEEGSFLVGAVAGRLTHSHQVGFVGGMKSPLIARFEVGYRAGVRATCPTCKVDAAYVGASPDAFKDPAKGKAIAFSQIASGADVLYHAAGASGTRGVRGGARRSRPGHRRRLRSARRHAGHGRHQHGQAHRRRRLPRDRRSAARSRDLRRARLRHRRRRRGLRRGRRARRRASRTRSAPRSTVWRRRSPAGRSTCRGSDGSTPLHSPSQEVILCA